MIELKIKGPKKRTVINSLKCEILKDKDKFFLMRFKSLPFNKKNARNLLWIDVPKNVKASIQNRPPQYFDSRTPQRQNLHNASQLQQYKKLWTEQLQKSYLFAQHKYLSKSQFSTYEKEEGEDFSLRKKTRTIETQPEESIVEYSLRNYIRRHLSLKQSSLKNDEKEAERLSLQHSQQMNSLKKSRNFRSNLTISKSGLIQQNLLRNLLEGTLSPKICRINKLGPLNMKADQQERVSLFRRAKINQNEQNSNSFQDECFGNKIKSVSRGPKKLKKLQLKNTGAFKHSIGPWRNSGFGLQT